MATLTPKQIAQHAANAGFSGNDLQIAVAVAIAESGGRTDVVNYLGCVGLWQVYQKYHPQWSTEQLKVPSTNAEAAYKIKTASHGWGDWTTYTGGAYKQHMAKAAAAVSGVSAGDAAGTGTSSSGGSSVQLLDANGNPVRVTGVGAAYSPSTKVLNNAPTMSDFKLMGSKLQGNAKEAVTSAQVEFTADQVSQVTLTVLDPQFDFLSSGLAETGTPATLQSQKLVVATTATSTESGNPLITIKCRPETVNNLKKRQGSLVMSNVSPSQFVKKECEAVGAHYFIQGSPSRPNVSRDLPEANKYYDLGDKPSTWTTFQRLANELGFICFEENNTIYFGQPTYFVDKGKETPFRVNYNVGAKNLRTLDIPECSKSLDDKEVTITAKLPLKRAAEARCGRAMYLYGMTPTFNGWYMVKGVSYDLAGSTEFITVQAGTPIDPVAQPPGGTGGAGSQIGEGTSDGSWPLPSKYKVTTAFGVKGSWAAGFHTGADFACPEGTDAYAVYDGKVVAVNHAGNNGGWGSAYGTHVILDVNGTRYAYCHLSRALVSTGQTVKSGQRIGVTGQTGRAFGPHLHLEARKAPYDYGKNSIDPVPLLMKKGVSSGGGATQSGTKLASDFVKFAQTRAGGKYVMGAARTYNPSQTVFDCSSLVYWALGQVGIKGFPTTTFTQEPYLRKKGKQITLDLAYRTRGALLYKSIGGDHVAISLGNGKTIEAANPRAGVVNLNSRGRGFNNAYLVPGLRY